MCDSSFLCLRLFCLGLLGCGWRVIRFSRGLRGSYNAYQWQQSGRLVLAGQRGQRAVQEPGTAKPDAD